MDNNQHQTEHWHLTSGKMILCCIGSFNSLEEIQRLQVWTLPNLPYCHLPLVTVSLILSIYVSLWDYLLSFRTFKLVFADIYSLQSCDTSLIYTIYSDNSSSSVIQMHDEECFIDSLHLLSSHASSLLSFRISIRE